MLRFTVKKDPIAKKIPKNQNNFVKTNSLNFRLKGFMPRNIVIQLLAPKNGYCANMDLKQKWNVFEFKSK